MTTHRTIALTHELLEAESILACALSLDELASDEWSRMMVERGRARVAALRVELEAAQEAPGPVFDGQVRPREGEAK